MGHKKKRQQPRPKKKKVKNSHKSRMSYGNQELRRLGEKLKEMLKDKEHLNASITEHISQVEEYFKRYDTIQLLGSVGLYLIDNLPNMEKYFMAGMEGKQLKLDEDAEVIAEYALNFGLSMPNDGQEEPPEKVVTDLRERLRVLSQIYRLIDMPLENNAEQYVDWVIHSEFIGVRGDGYQTHVYEVFREMFGPHTAFYEKTYGFSIDELFDFFMDLENRIVCKIGDQNTIYGAIKLHDRWIKWEEETFGPIGEEDGFVKRDFSKGMFGEFFEANPDIGHTVNGDQFLLYEPDDYTASDKVFWVWPQNETEKKILESLSSEFGSNAAFIAEGEFKGNIMNGHSIYEKPFVKDGGKYYCFTPMMPHRNLFLIAEKLMKRDDAYYQKNFQQNTNRISRDQYVERKVKTVLESFLPTVTFYSSVYYSIVEDGEEKKPEVDILGLSDKATFVVEVKAHELSHKDRVGIKGTKDKFQSSVGEACEQCKRAKTHIDTSEAPHFCSAGSVIEVDQVKPVYKIAVTFQHYSSLLGQMDKLIEAGMMKDEYRDTWIVSLFDLMVFADFIKSEDELIAYLETHKTIYCNHSQFFDEIDLLNGFINHDLRKKVKLGKPMIIKSGSVEIDEEYANDYRLPIEGMMPGAERLRHKRKWEG
jgi:hypothetical protein